MKKTTLMFNRSLFLDSSNIDEIKVWNATGIIDGVTTNQMVMLKDGVTMANYYKTVKTICRIMKGKPVSIELTDSTLSAVQMIREAKRLRSLASNIVIKVPLIPNTTKSLEVISELVYHSISVNVTVLMTFEQLIMAILATRFSKKISFVSFFWGRSIEDHAKYRSRPDFMFEHQRVGFNSLVNESPKTIMEAATDFLQKGGYDNTRIIVGSLRSATMVGEAFAAGAHIATAAPDILKAMLFSKRGIETIEQFDSSWLQVQKKK